VIAFLDTSAIIYLIEGSKPLADKVGGQLRALLKKDPHMRTAVSRLARLECRVAPLRDDDVDTLAVYDSFFARPDLICVELDAEVIELATAIRARHGLKTPDALQVACCLQLGSDHLFLSGDKGLRRVAGLNVELLG
jgi:predicted nucleic acid-binding protein